MDKELLEKIYTKFISVLLNGYKTGEVEEGIVWKHSLHSMGPWCSPLTIDILEKEFDDIPEIGPHIFKFCNATWGNGYTALTNIAETYNEYHYLMDMKTGFFAEWGHTLDDDIIKAPAHNILDIEVTTKCTGPGNYLGGGKTESGCCPFCYKSNTPNGKNMSLDTFKKIIDKMPITLTQIAIIADDHLDQNPYLWDMMLYAKSRG